MSSPFSLLDVLAAIPDPRHRRGIRHPLSAILGLAVLAMLTGCKSYQAIAQFGRDKGFALAQLLGFRRSKTPTKATYSILFRRLDVVAFEAALIIVWDDLKNLTLVVSACSELRAYMLSGGCRFEEKKGGYAEKGQSFENCLLKKATDSLESNFKMKEFREYSAELFVCCVWNECTRFVAFPRECAGFRPHILDWI